MAPTNTAQTQGARGTWHNWLLGIGQVVLQILISFGYHQANKAALNNLEAE